jgi:hypothetical protein
VNDCEKDFNRNVREEEPQRRKEEHNFRRLVSRTSRPLLAYFAVQSFYRDAKQISMTDPQTSLPQSIPTLDQSSRPDLLTQISADPLTEDMTLALLQRRDLLPEALENLSKNAIVTKSRKVRFAFASHPRVPRHISLRLVREFYTIDLMRFALLPSVAADIKHAADDLLVARLASITLGERISLARRASGAVAAALLLDKEARVWQTALENPRLTEAAIVKTLLRAKSNAAFVETVCHHSKWSVRPEIRMALLRNEKTPLARALEFAGTLPPAQLRDILHSSRLPEKIKMCLLKESKTRTKTG